MKKNTVIITIVIVVFLAILIYTYLGNNVPKVNDSIDFRSQVMPGELSAAHALLSKDCNSCHTATKGIDDAKCISCHSNNTALLERKPTDFHATLANCASCHIEHRGADANLRVMDHEALAKIASTLILSGDDNSFQISNQTLPADHPMVSAKVAQLDCASCHSTKDKHLGLLGQNCASCHSATEWTIPVFQHPKLLSIDCAQCHKAPPSHFMEHFSMISQKIARQENAKVNECYSCHKTTSFNDIKGVGYYKHH